MIVLDQHAVGEIEPMVVSAATADRVFIQQAHSRNGLARVENSRLRAADYIHVASRDGRDAAHALKQIQDHALAGKNHASIVANHGNRLSIVQTNAIEHLRMADDFMMSNDRFIQIAVDLENAIHRSQTGQDASLLGVDRGGRAHARIDASLGRGVAGGAVFEKSALKDL